MTFIRKSQYARFKHWALDNDHWRGVPLQVKARMLRVSSGRYRDLALLHPETTADNIITSIRMLKQAMVCERLREGGAA